APVPAAVAPVRTGSGTAEVRDHDGTLSDGTVFADELLRFAGVGLVSTVAYVALFALLDGWIGAYAANAVAIAGCSLGNTAAHRGMAGTVRLGLDRRHRLLVAGALFGISLGFTTVALALTRALGLDALAPELVAVTVANVAAAAFRFAILRTWVFRPHFGTRLDPVTVDGSGPVGVPSPVVTPETTADPLSHRSTADRTPARTSR
ncbi:MAG TPA: hypothetical protein VF279_01700, partial [Acidimicrobiales bacterium]